MDNKKNSIYSMKLHERIFLDGGATEILRVVDGWIYRFRNNAIKTLTTYDSVFVPDNSIRD